MIEIPEIRGKDIHGLEYLDEAELILFMAGNQFMVMDELLQTFKEEYGIERIFYETLPPGLLLKQILEGAKFKDVELPRIPDVYSSVSEDNMRILKEKGYIDDYFVYLHNRIVLMVRKGNPKGIKSIFDLAREDVVVSHPNPENEDIGKYIVQMYLEVGGEELRRKVMEEKAKRGSTIFTTVHHRETPERILNGKADAGWVWATEVIYAQMRGLPVEMVEVEIDMSDRVNYYIAKLKNAPNPENADKFLEFIKSDKAQKIYRKYGFVPLEE